MNHNRAKRARRRWSTWWSADAGSVAAEATLLAPVLAMLLVFVAVIIHRGVDAQLRLNDAAHQAARSASIERTTGQAVASASSTAAGSLASAGLSCTTFTVDTSTGGLQPGGIVTVAVSCTVDLSDALFPGLPGQRRLSATATEPVDTWRSSDGQRGGA